MENKEIFEASEKLQAKMVELAQHSNGGMELAKLVGQPYDEEIAIPVEISAIMNVDTVERGEDYDYFVPTSETKVVYTVTNGSVTQTAVTPETENTLSFSSYDSPEYFVYLEKMLEGKSDDLMRKNINANEALNRLEVKTVMDLLIAAATAESNTYTLDSGKTKFDYPKLVEMARSVARYGKNLVLLSGANVTTDIVLMDYDADKNREVSLEKLGVQHIPVEEFQYTHSGVQTVLDADKAILVAVSDSADMKCGDFVRRKVRDIQGAGDKERVTISSGPAKHVGSDRKLAYGLVVFEQFGAVIKNTKPIAVFTRS